MKFLGQLKNVVETIEGLDLVWNKNTPIVKDTWDPHKQSLEIKKVKLICEYLSNGTKPTTTKGRQQNPER